MGPLAARPAGADNAAMQPDVPDLWPPEVEQTAVLTPLLILRHQAGLLRKRSGGVLEAEVTSDAAGDGTRHAVDLIVPSLGRLRVRLLSVRHLTTEVYPAWVDLGDDDAADGDGAATQAEFLAALGQLLASPSVRSALQSLLAQAHEAAARRGR